ncbi:VPA1262 family N-terminal domain-containing protein [Paraburkholderia sp. 22099]|uniref:VPA1262 family N-terminal domain-containing protein n=1 Tax=Paraburkholderia sp. 22099 TaxID=3453875 RepID=UPI003F85F76F
MRPWPFELDDDLDRPFIAAMKRTPTYKAQGSGSGENPRLLNKRSEAKFPLVTIAQHSERPSADNIPNAASSKSPAVPDFWFPGAVTEHRPTGICAVHRITVQQPYFVIPHNAWTEQVELIISCPERGILDWQEPFGFVREVNISGSLVGATKRVIIPGKNGETDHYDVPMKTAGWSSTRRDAVLAGGIPARLRSSEFDRQRADEAARLGQKWFHGSHSEATTFIRDLIGKARKRVWIVDPYFATTEFFGFALATAYDDMDVLILTSGEELKKTDQIDAVREAGEVLLSQLESRKDMSHIKVRVMTGTPAVHDRFLVIDDKVWLTGNSLNSIGDRAGMMISVPEPSVVVDKLNEIIHDAQRTKKLSEWVANRKAGGES